MGGELFMNRQIY